MTDQKHSPTPWLYDKAEKTIFDSNDEPVCNLDDDTRPDVNGIYAKIDAALIVTAVNSHEKLVDLLRLISKVNMEFDNSPVEAIQTLREFKRLATITLAESGEPEADDAKTT